MAFFSLLGAVLLGLGAVVLALAALACRFEQPQLSKQGGRLAEALATIGGLSLAIGTSLAGGGD